MKNSLKRDCRKNGKSTVKWSISPLASLINNDKLPLSTNKEIMATCSLSDWRPANDTSSCHPVTSRLVNENKRKFRWVILSNIYLICFPKVLATFTGKTIDLQGENFGIGSEAIRSTKKGVPTFFWVNPRLCRVRVIVLSFTSTL